MALPAAVLPGVVGTVTGSPWRLSALSAVLLATAVLAVTPALTLRMLQPRGTALLDAMASRSAAILRSSTQLET